MIANKAKLVIIGVLIVLILGGCTLTNKQSNVPSIVPSPSFHPNSVQDVNNDMPEFAAKVKDIPYPKQWPEDQDVIMRFDSDPRFTGSSLSVLVPKRDESVTIFFKDKMNRESVEQAIQKNLADPNDSYNVFPRMQYYWASDVQLHVKFFASELDNNRYGRYSIGLEGAVTLMGKSIGQYFFAATLDAIDQWWELRIDDRSIKQLTSFEEPYVITPLDAEGRYLMLSKFSSYCECDKDLPRLFSIYDISTGGQVDYPIEAQLVLNYMGSGSFVADKRGFFYEEPKSKEVSIPASETAMTFNNSDYIHSAAFSKDRQNIIMITGPKEPGKDVKLDLVIIEVATGKEKKLKQVVAGRLPVNDMNGFNEPIRFNDNGKEVYFALQQSVSEGYEQLWYRYNWESQKLANWEPPVALSFWAELEFSDDHRFGIYGDGNIYEGNKKVDFSSDLQMIGNGVWLPGGHDYVMINNELNAPSSLSIVDANTLQTATYDQISVTSGVLHSVSKDGKHLYLSVNNLSHK
jgi:hypothetical protein